MLLPHYIPNSCSKMALYTEESFSWRLDRFRSSGKAIPRPCRRPVAQSSLFAHNSCRVVQGMGASFHVPAIHLLRELPHQAT